MSWHGHHHTYQRTCPVYKGKCLGFNTTTSSSSSGSSSRSSNSGSSSSSSSSSNSSGTSGSSSSNSDSSSGAIGVALGPVHLVIGHGGADLSLNVELWPSEIWEVSGGGGGGGGAKWRLVGRGGGIEEIICRGERGGNLSRP